MLTIKKVYLKNILGIEEKEIELGKYNEISGKNGQGKSSIIKGISAAITGGSVAHLRRTGSKKSEIVLLLSDGTEVKKSVTPKTSSLDVKKAIPVGETGQKYLNELFDSVSINPVQFLEAKPKEQAKILLQSVNMRIKPEDLTAITGVEYPEEIKDYHALEVIEPIRKQIFDERTGINRSVKDYKGFIAKSEEALVEATADPAELKEQIIIAEKELKDAEILLHEKRDQLKDLKMNLERTNKYSGQLEALEQNKKQLQEKEEESSKLTEQINKLDQLTEDLMKDLPIEGISVKEGIIYKEDVPFDTLNTAEQLTTAVKLAIQRAGKLSIVIVDGIDALDSERKELFIKELEKYPEVQCIATKVADHKLKIESK